MSLAQARFSDDMPDGYQVIDVTTGETVHFREHQILTYAMAWEIRVGLNQDQYVIVAVNADDLERENEGNRKSEYVPGFVTFAGAALTDQTIDSKTQLPEFYVDPTDGPQEVTMTPSAARNVISVAGLPLRSGSQAQYRWPILEAQERIEAAISDNPTETALRQQLNEMLGLITAVSLSGGSYLILGYNGFDAKACA